MDCAVAHECARQLARALVRGLLVAGHHDLAQVAQAIERRRLAVDALVLLAVGRETGAGGTRDRGDGNDVAALCRLACRVR